MSYIDRLRRNAARGSYHSRPGATQSTKPLIYWDQSHNKYIVKTPWDKTKTPDYVKDLKNILFTASYNGNQDKSWSVDESELDTLKVIVQSHFGQDNFDFIPKPDSNFSMNSTKLDGASAAALEIFRIAGKDATLIAKRAMSKVYHPDVNKAPGANEILAQINAAFDQLLKEMGW